MIKTAHSLAVLSVNVLKHMRVECCNILCCTDIFLPRFACFLSRVIAIIACLTQFYFTRDFIHSNASYNDYRQFLRFLNAPA